VKDIKAVKLLGFSKVIKPGQAISWTVYDGNDILESKAVHNYVNGFLMSGEKMPIPWRKVMLNVISVETEYHDYLKTHKVIVEGIFEKEKTL